VAGDRLVVVANHRLGVISIADWSLRALPLVVGGVAGVAVNVVHGLEVVGDTAYVAGRYLTVNGQARPFLAALDLATGMLLPFDASPDAEVDSVRFANGRLWVAGRFRRIGGGSPQRPGGPRPGHGSCAFVEPRRARRRLSRRRQ